MAFPEWARITFRPVFTHFLRSPQKLCFPMAGFPNENSTLWLLSIATGFSTCMQVSLSFLITNGIRTLPYLDNWLLCVSTNEQVIRGMSTLLTHKTALSLTGRSLKSSLTPKQATKFTENGSHPVTPMCGKHYYYACQLDTARLPCPEPACIEDARINGSIWTDTSPRLAGGTRFSKERYQPMAGPPKCHRLKLFLVLVRETQELASEQCLIKERE